MPDKSDKRAMVDRTRIDAEQNWELQYWSTKFKVSPADVRAAISSVGPMVEDVRKSLGATLKPGRW